MSTQPGDWQQPKTDWKAGDVVSSADLNRIEQNIQEIELGNRGLDPSQAPTGNVGNLRQILDWLANRIAAIYGEGNWYDDPIKSLAQLQAEKVGRGAANTDVELIKALLHRVDTRSLAITYDNQGRPAMIREMDGSNVIRTTVLSYDPSGRLAQVQESAGGTTVTSTLTYGPNGSLVGVSKAVI